MADKEKKVAQNSKVDKATTDESSAAAKVAKAAKGNKKSDKPNFFARASKGTKQFFRDFKGECKKIVWPDAKTVLKSTGIVLIVVTIVALLVLAIDSGLSAGVKGLKNLAMGETEVTTTAPVEDEHDHDHEGEEAEKEDSKEQSEEKAEEQAAEDKAETTSAEAEE